MELPINKAQPLIMHIDLNSAFAMIEQQANPFLRYRPVAMTNRLTRGATIIAASYEAKRHGIGVGTKMNEAQQLVPDVTVLETDPPKYIYAHKQFLKILQSYSPSAHMKSVDEGVIDFHDSQWLHQITSTADLISIGQEIKSRLKTTLGSYITCNVGIGPNRWLAKTAASLHKPDGLDVIDHSNLLAAYDQLKLLDLTGINHRYAARLRTYGIMNPHDFFEAPEEFLRRYVFNSIVGHYWYLRLRGWEVDAAIPATRSIGKQYVLHEWTADPRQLSQIMLKMCEMMGRRLRAKKLCARGLYVGCWFLDPPPGISGGSTVGRGGWHIRHKFQTRIYTTAELFERAWQLFQDRPTGVTVKLLSVTCYDLEPADNRQLDLFVTADQRRWRLMNAVDELNDRFGEFTVMPGQMLGTQNWVPDKIPFGSTRYF
ncbi:hypothetical protein HY346_01605 [Candidatus Microgenomates bacterium]|nr:hypothetical protein [Candidatus Microgenomates bacterium]